MRTLRRRAAVAAFLCTATALTATSGPHALIATAEPAVHETQSDLPNLIKNPGASDRVLIASHRGDWRDAPENSLAAIETAVANGAEIIELDVHLSSDGIPVLMHDDTIDRPTREEGRVDAYTAEALGEIRLLNHMGRDDNAELTSETIPTLEQAIELIDGRTVINIDKGWAARHEIVEVLERTGTQNLTIMKGAPSVEEATDFMRAHPDVHYAHILNQNSADAFAFPADATPEVWEVVFRNGTEPQAQPEFLDVLSQTGHVWINSLWDSLAAGNTDEASLRDSTDLGWQNLVDDYSASIIQTNNVAAMNYWRAGGAMNLWEQLPDGRSIRIQPETSIIEDKSEDSDENLCAATSPQYERVDVCDGSTFNHTRNALALAHTAPGEIVTMQFDVETAGTYEVVVRTGGQHADAGKIQFYWNNQPGAFHDVRHTSHLGIFMQDVVETREFATGTQTVTMVLPADYRQYFNLDYVQLNRIEDPAPNQPGQSSHSSSRSSSLSSTS